MASTQDRGAHKLTEFLFSIISCTPRAVTLPTTAPAAAEKSATVGADLARAELPRLAIFILGPLSSPG